MSVPPSEQPEGIASKVFSMLGDIASSVASGFIPPEMIVQAIEKGEGAITTAVQKMPPAQRQQFINVIKHILAVAERSAAAPVAAPSPVAAVAAPPAPTGSSRRRHTRRKRNYRK